LPLSKNAVQAIFTTGRGSCTRLQIQVLLCSPAINGGGRIRWPGPTRNFVEIRAQNGQLLDQFFLSNGSRVKAKERKLSVVRISAHESNICARGGSHLRKEFSQKERTQQARSRSAKLYVSWKLVDSTKTKAQKGEVVGVRDKPPTSVARKAHNPVESSKIRRNTCRRSGIRDVFDIVIVPCGLQKIQDPACVNHDLLQVPMLSPKS